eukprot:366444-Chlamydomonas_euryale.AAC.31
MRPPVRALAGIARHSAHSVPCFLLHSTSTRSRLRRCAASEATAAPLAGSTDGQLCGLSAAHAADACLGTVVCQSLLMPPPPHALEWTAGVAASALGSLHVSFVCPDVVRVESLMAGGRVTIQLLWRATLEMFTPPQRRGRWRRGPRCSRSSEWTRWPNRVRSLGGALEGASSSERPRKPLGRRAVRCDGQLRLAASAACASRAR